METDVEYRCEATSPEGFVQQLAVCYLRNGYWFYVLGEVPAGKDPRAVDDKLTTRYEIAVSKWTRARAKDRGEAKLQYLRYMTTFVLIATHGNHHFFEDEKGQIRDVRERPIRFFGYSIGYKDGHPHVRIATGQYRELEDAFLGLALFLPPEVIAARFWGLPFEPYGPVKLQLKKLLAKVNRARAAAGLEKVPLTCLRTRRKTVLPFETAAVATVSAK